MSPHLSPYEAGDVADEPETKLSPDGLEHIRAQLAQFPPGERRKILREVVQSLDPDHCLEGDDDGLCLLPHGHAGLCLLTPNERVNMQSKDGKRLIITEVSAPRPRSVPGGSR